MTDVDQQVRDAFADVRAPEAVKRQTLAFIESRRGCDDSLAAAESVPSALKRGRRTATARRWRFAAPIAACALLVALCLGGATAYCTPVAYVDIDVNPSLELSVNRFGIVVDARGLNGEGCAVVNEVDLAHCPYAEAIDRLAACQALSPYVSADTIVDVVVSATSAAQADRLERESETGLSKLSCQTACSQADGQTHESAHACGMSMGRYALAQQLVEADGSLSMDECATMSMRELRDLAASHGLSCDDGQEGESGDHGSEDDGSEGGSVAEGCYGSGSDHGSGNGHGGGHARGHGGHARGSAD